MDDRQDLDTRDVSPRFLEAAQRLAELLAEDVNKVVAGSPLTYKGITFSLKHHGMLDPAGMVLAIDAGPLDSQNGKLALKAVLRHNFDTPAALGYFAVPPDRDSIAWCTRIDFDDEPNPVGKVAFMLEQMATTSEVFGDAIRHAAGKALRSAEPHFDAA